MAKLFKQKLQDLNKSIELIEKQKVELITQEYLSLMETVSNNYQMGLIPISTMMIQNLDLSNDFLTQLNNIK